MTPEPTPVPFPQAQILTSAGGVPAELGGCGSWTNGHGSAVTDCGPYEYLPISAPQATLLAGGHVTFALADGWTFGSWSLRAIRERELPADWVPVEQQPLLGRGSGGAEVIGADLPAGTGDLRVFLLFDATRGSERAIVDRAYVFLIRLTGPTVTAESVADPLASARHALGLDQAGTCELDADIDGGTGDPADTDRLIDAAGGTDRWLPAGLWTGSATALARALGADLAFVDRGNLWVVVHDGNRSHALGFSGWATDAGRRIWQVAGSVGVTSCASPSASGSASA